MGGRGGSSGLSNSSSVSFNMKGEEKYKDSIKVLKVLFNEYETRLHEVTSGSQNSAGSVDISGYRMQLSSTDQATAIHEFAHTLANSAAEKYGLTKHADFWKEIKAMFHFTSTITTAALIRCMGDSALRVWGFS